jgi:hypothetical protein
VSVVLTYTKAHDLAQLHQELLAAGLAPERVEGERVEVVTPDPDPDQGDVVTYEDRITLTMPDGVDEPATDAVVAAHVPMERYDPTTKLAELARTREASRLRADYDRLAVLFLAVADSGDPVAAIQTATEALIGVLKRRDRAAGLY